MGIMQEAYKKEQEEIKRFRAKMAADNKRHMEELAKKVPTPTIEEVQAALMGVPKKSAEPVAPKIDESTAPKIDEPPVVEKVSEPKPAVEKGNYVTRASVAKDK